MKNISRSIAFGMIIGIVIMSCQGKKADTSNATSPAAESTPVAAPAVVDNAAGKKTFETYCILCHGADGKLGLNGSKDLTISERPIEERIAQVTNGKGTMTPFKDILTEEEIKAVAQYTLSLKK